jgi:hypothetical protein
MRLNRSLASVLLLGSACWTVSGFAEPGAIRQESDAGITHSFLVTGTTTSALFDEACNVVWEVKGYSRDGYVMGNGNILISTGKALKEYAAGTYDVVWSYELQEPNTELSTVMRLDDGNTLTCELGPNPRLLELDADGQIAVEVPLKPETDNYHMQTRMARKLPNGNYLVPHLFAFAVKEYTRGGEVVRTIRTDLPQFGGREVHNWPFTAILLENGNVLANLTHGDKVAEFAPDGTVTWKVDAKDVPGHFSDACGGQRLPNGNTVISAYGQKDPAKPKMFEVTRDKQVVWRFYHPEIHVHEVHIITTNGERVSPVLR